jgi:hypothetical protein
MSTPQLKEIKITGYHDAVVNILNSETPQLVFTLSEEPPEDWKELFHQKRIETGGNRQDHPLITGAYLRGSLLFVVIRYETLSSDPFTRFDFKRPLDYLKGIVRSINEEYWELERQAKEKRFALSKMLGQLKYD